MELGMLRFRCQGTNVLQGAVHEEHGLVWTEGRGIFLSPISIFQGQLENQEHSKLGEFDDNVPRESRGVKSIHWSDSVSPGLCYMCVVHEKNISIWKVEGQQPKLTFKQVRKVNIQPIPHGCVWCPDRDILCVLCPLQSSIYYSHVQNKGSQVLLQIDRDKIRCGCWTADGSKLVICAGTTLMVYHWSDVDKSVTQYTAVPWTVPRLTGKITSIVPVSDNRVLFAAELPLESLCKQRDTFVLPDLLNSNSNGPIKDGHSDNEIIKPKGQEASVTETLFNLPRNQNSVVEACSRLDLIELVTDQDPVCVSTCNVTGVLTPDLLLYQAKESRVYVGCNTQTLIQIYTLSKSTISKTDELELNKDERPKGVACLPHSCSHGNSGVLILVGKKASQDSAFPSATPYINMKSVLKFFNLKQGRYSKNPLSHTTSAPSIPITVATNGNHDNKDYEGIYESVMNFGTNLKQDKIHGKSAIDIKDNNNSVHKPVSKSSSVLVNNVVQDDFARVKVNGSHRNSYHGDGDFKVVNSEQSDKVQDNMPVAPKRPLRKKRSIRNKDDLSRTSSNSSQSTNRSRADSGVKMPMEYLSDSSEMSPRDSPGSSARKHIDNDGAVDTRIDSPEMARNTAQVVDHLKEMEKSRLTDSEKLESESGKREDTNISKVQDSDRMSAVHSDSNSRDGGIIVNIGRTEVAGIEQGKVRIVELDQENHDTGVLEVETVEFHSQTRNFKSSDLSKLCTEENVSQRQVEEYMDKKLKSKDTTGSGSLAVSQAVVGPKLSSSLESLDDIDKLLKEQNEKITKLQEQMNRLSRRVDESSCVLPTRYKSFNKPDTVQICFRCTDGYKIEKKFLMDNGRIQLEQIKQAFSLDTVEMIIDDEACVVGCNIDGYIPVRFEPGCTIYISGKPALH